MTLGNRSGAPCVRREELGKLGAEGVVGPCGAKVALEINQRGHERLGNEAAPEFAEATETDRFGPGRPELDGHAARMGDVSHRRPSSRTGAALGLGTHTSPPAAPRLPGAPR